MITSLEPQEEFEFIWNQKKNDGKQVLEGIYKITSNAITKNENKKTCWGASRCLRPSQQNPILYLHNF